MLKIQYSFSEFVNELYFKKRVFIFYYNTSWNDNKSEDFN